MLRNLGGIIQARSVWRKHFEPNRDSLTFVTLDEQIITTLGFGAAAWQTAPRDQFIGWSHEQRQRNLPLITAYETRIKDLEDQRLVLDEK